ncbi:hypothetical protein JCM16358_03510 [Halanaerocella petrolearia]
MSRYNKLERMIKKIERVLIRSIIIGFILIVAVQIILTNPNLKNSLISKVPMVDEFLVVKKEPNFNAPAKKVFSIQNEYATLSLQNGLRLSEVKLLINDQVVDNFKNGEVKFKIEPGDIVAIDARGYKKGLWFKATDLSTSVSIFKEQQQFWIKDEYKVLGQIKKLNKF